MNRIIYAIAAAMVICVSMAVYSESAAEDLQENVMRLHIIANSDSDADQEVKIKVRDAILAAANKGATADDFKEIADNTLHENGFTYSAGTEFGKFYFPKKTYKDMTFPAGEYNGLRVILGDGKGKNWWCVMNPPLCFTEDADGKMSAEGQTELKSALNGETYEIITGKPEIKFKIVEIFGELK